MGGITTRRATLEMWKRLEDQWNLGDVRADTPGHSAKYGTYSMLDLDEGVVVDIQLVQVQHYFN